MKILIIDNTRDPDSWGSSDLVRSVRLSALTENPQLVVRRAPEFDLHRRPDGFTHVIVSGSRTEAHSNEDWVAPLLKYLDQIIEARIPVLGVCFGHQMLARLYGEKSKIENPVGPSETPELGYVQIRLNENAVRSPLWNQIPNSFYAPVTHFDEVYELSPELVVDAHSDRCRIQSFYVPEKPVFGIQFHPERTYQKVMNTWKKNQKTEKARYFFGQKLKNDDINEQLHLRIFKNFLGIKTR